MSWFNEEHYPDPTAFEAMDHTESDGHGAEEMNEEGLRRLAEAAAVLAAQDYLQLLRCSYRSEALLRERRELEAFFESPRFRDLYGMDGKRLLRRIRKEARLHDRP